MVSLPLSYSTAFSTLRQDQNICWSFRFFIFILWSAGTAKSTRWQILFLLINTWSGLLNPLLYFQMLCFLWIGPKKKMWCGFASSMEERRQHFIFSQSPPRNGGRVISLNSLVSCLLFLFEFGSQLASLILLNHRPSFTLYTSFSSWYFSSYA